MLYLTLFTASLLAATLLPGGSEALLLYDLSQTDQIFPLFLAATLGNTAGSAVNYLLGKKGVTYLTEKGYASHEVLVRAHTLFERYGAWALLLSWMPVIGDPITLIAGVARYAFFKFLLWVLIAKGVRYGVVIALSPYFLK
ncbi:MAG: DedA family protein [Sulfurospirillum sp.]|nr:MAG: DedA family protein [Sulfurospirillum sp.]